MILRQEFFERPVLQVAPDLLGKVLVRRWRGKEIAGVITEVEVYDGPCDKASHASRGMTERNKVMFGEAGRFYVYFTYGMHWILNVVTGDEGYPAAVLIRGSRIFTNEGTNDTNIRVIRGDISGHSRLLDGPGKLTKFLHIDKKLNGKPAFTSAYTKVSADKKALARRGGLWIEDRGIVVPRGKIKRTPRIGVHYAEEWAGKPYRFLIKT